MEKVKKAGDSVTMAKLFLKAMVPKKSGPLTPIHFQKLIILSFIQIQVSPKVNELEWVDGKIYANIYERDAIAIVDPTNGAVEGVIDLSDLKSKVTQHEALNVLNGIAYNGEENILYITGKNWDKLFKIEVVEK